MRMIELVKAMGAYHHTCFDQQFGVEAFARVKEEESVRLRQQADTDERKANHEVDDQDTETDSDEENPLDDEEQPIDSDLSSRPPRDAKETVAARVYARFCMASAGFGEPYTDVDVEQLFKEEYERFGEPSSAAQWVEDRLFVRQQLVDNEIRQPYTTEELKALSQEALRLYPQPSSCPL